MLRLEIFTFIFNELLIRIWRVALAIGPVWIGFLLCAGRRLYWTLVLAWVDSVIILFSSSTECKSYFFWNKTIRTISS
jgi:type IV secretory pathway VirB2 component (pilin)